MAAALETLKALYQRKEAKIIKLEKLFEELKSDIIEQITYVRSQLDPKIGEHQFCFVITDRKFLQLFGDLYRANESDSQELLESLVIEFICQEYGFDKDDYAWKYVPTEKGAIVGSKFDITMTPKFDEFNRMETLLIVSEKHRQTGCEIWLECMAEIKISRPALYEQAYGWDEARKEKE